MSRWTTGPNLTLTTDPKGGTFGFCKENETHKSGDVCEFCGEAVDMGDAVSLEAPEEYAERHTEDKARIVKVWHRACFEEEFKVKLPMFGVKDEKAAPFDVKIVEK